MLRRAAVVACLVIAASAAVWAQMPRTTAPEGAAVYFIAPQNGGTVASPVALRFGLSGLGVAPAGVANENTGHHHLLIDVAEMPPLDQPLPATDNVKHFDGGQTETTIELPPGTHTLQLLVGDMNYVPFDPPMVSEEITITVE